MYTCQKRKAITYIEFLESFDKLNTLVVSGSDKRLSSHVQL